MAINQIQTLTFKSQANSDPCNANICTLLEVHVLSNSLMIHCKGRVCLFCFRNRYWSWHPKGIFSWKQSYSPLYMSFFLDRSLGLKYYTDSRCLWRFSACMQEQKGQCPMFPQHINCCSCGDLPFYSTFLNPYFLLKELLQVCAGQQTHKSPPLSFHQTFTLHKSEKHYLAFYYFYLKA